jgi:exosortase
MPGSFLAALAVASAFMVFLAFDQAHWWRLKPDYAFGWLVPVFAAYVIAIRWPRLKAIVGAGRSSPLPRGLKSAVSLAAGASLVLGLGFFLLGALYRSASGPTQPGSFALAAGNALVLLSMVYFNTPDGGAETAGTGLAAALRGDARLRAASLFLFPALIWILSAPLASAVENSISLFLLRKVVAVVFAIFDTLGFSLVQEGNVLVLPKGQVGVAEACSGIRSLTGCLFAGSFLAAVSLDRLWKKTLLVAASLVFAFLMNLLRSLFLTGWAYAYGSAAIEGTLHDATGFAVLGLTSICLIGMLPLFRTGHVHSQLEPQQAAP